MKKNIKDNKISIVGKHDEALKEVTLAESEESVDLYMATSKQLTGESYAHPSQIYYNIWNNGYCACPLEVGLQLKLQYDNQPVGEHLAVVSEPIVNFGPHGVYLYRTWYLRHWPDSDQHPKYRMFEYGGCVDYRNVEIEKTFFLFMRRQD